MIHFDLRTAPSACGQFGPEDWSTVNPALVVCPACREHSTFHERVQLTKLTKVYEQVQSDTEQKSQISRTLSDEICAEGAELYQNGSLEVSSGSGYDAGTVNLSALLAYLASFPEGRTMLEDALSRL